MIPLESFAVSLQELLPEVRHESDRALLRQAFAGEPGESIGGAPLRVQRMARILFPDDASTRNQLEAAALEAVSR